MYAYWSSADGDHSACSGTVPSRALILLQLFAEYGSEYPDYILVVCRISKGKTWI